MNDHHILYYHMSTYRSTVLRYNFFQSPVHLVVQGWTRDMLRHPTNVALVSLNVQYYSRFFPWVVDYADVGNIVGPGHKIVVVLEIHHHFIVTTFPAP